LERIRKSLGAVQGWDFEILCVNDGSIDNTAEILAQFSDIRVITHKQNRGYGAALRTGIRKSRGEWVSIVDADGTYPIEDFGKIIDQADDETAMVVGKREGAGITSNPFKRLARWILRKMVHALTGTMVPDLNSGMRIFTREIFNEFQHLLPQGFSFTSTITVSCLYRGYNVKYTPINYEKRVGKSHINPIKDFMRFSLLFVRLASYFEPLRFFTPAAFLFISIALGKAIRDYLVVGAIGNAALIGFALGIQILFTGILADVLSRRVISPGN